MTVFLWIAAALVVGLAAYLFAALLAPERFE
jgi:K+-transporting ATPase KdpF subunit